MTFAGSWFRVVKTVLAVAFMFTAAVLPSAAWAQDPPQGYRPPDAGQVQLPVNLSTEGRARLEQAYSDIVNKGPSLTTLTSLYEAYEELPGLDKSSVRNYILGKYRIDLDDPAIQGTAAIAGVASFFEVTGEGPQSLGEAISQINGGNDVLARSFGFQSASSFQNSVDTSIARVKQADRPAGIFKGVSRQCFREGLCSLCDILIVLIEITNIILRLLVILALVFFLWGAGYLLLSSGNEQMVTKGKSIIRATIIGTIITLVAWQLMAIIVTVLATNSSSAIFSGANFGRNPVANWFDVATRCGNQEPEEPTNDPRRLIR